MNARATAAQIAVRVEEILRIRLDGAEAGWDVCGFVREQEKKAGSVWAPPSDGKPLSASQMRRYVVKAEKLITESCRASRKKRIRLHLARRRNLYAKAVSAGDYRMALAALDSEAKLLGLYQARTPLDELLECLPVDLSRAIRLELVPRPD